MKALRIVAVLCGCAAAVQLAYLFLFRNAGRIGVIGGADGPTAIFVAGRLNPVMQYGLLAICSLASIAATAAILVKRKKKP